LEAEVAKDKIETESSLNKIVFRAIDEIEAPYIDKLKFLQLQKIESRIEYIMKIVNEKTENMKSVFGLEDKVRQEMYAKNQNKKKLPVIARSIFDGMDNQESNKEIMDKMKDKKLPDNVKNEI
jgi:ATP-dependent Lon protease